MSNLRVPVNYGGIYNATSLIDYLGQTAIDALCTCAYMESSIGGLVVGVTDWSSDLTGVPGYPGITFRRTTGMTASKIEHPSGVEPTNVEVDVFISAAALSVSDIGAGKWDHGRCTIFTTNANALDMGQLIEADGFFTEFTQLGRMFRTELRGRNEALRQVIGRVTEPLCDANYGDARCKLDLVARGEVHSVTLSAVTSQTVFRASSLTQPAEYFDNAEGVFTSGLNDDFPFHVDSWNPTTKEFTLRQALPFLPSIGDGITVKRGCKKRESDCISRGNMTNHRSFGDGIPTVEAFTRLPVVV